MAKGLGAILAQAEQFERGSRIANGESIRCPLCGEEMKFEGVAWFCRSGSKKGNGSNYPCLNGEIREAFFEANPKAWASQFGRDPFAAVVIENDDGSIDIPVKLHAVRGFGGCMNLSASASREIVDQIPELVKKYGWIYQEWIPQNRRKV